MSRGTDDFTVQQLMNFLGERIAAMEEELPNQHKLLGYAYMSCIGQASSNAAWHAGRIQDLIEKRDKIQQLSWDIERQCGELYDFKQKSEVQP